MRRPNRNIEIFSMSVLDMFASALGAFILITIVLFPDYNKKQQLQVQVQQAQSQLVVEQRRPAQAQAEARAADRRAQQAEQRAREAQAATAAAQAATARAQQESATLRGEVASLREELAKTFLIVTAEWSEPGRNDVDLHVTDAEGNEFYFQKNNRNRTDFPGSEGQLSVDATSGPGLELFQLPVAKAGFYKVEVVLYSKSQSTSGAIAVRCNVFARRGRMVLHEVQLNSASERVLVSSIEVMADGTVRAESSSGSQ